MYDNLLVKVLIFSMLLGGCKKPDPIEIIRPTTPPKPFPIARIATRVSDRLPHTHLSHDELDDAIAIDALMLFIDSLDFDHSYFLASDIEHFQQQGTLLDDQVKEGDTSFAHKVFDRFKECLTNRTAYVNQLLNDGFDLTLEETYCWKRDKEPWPATEDAQNELWRQKIKNEFVARTAALATESENEEDVSTNDLEVVEALSPDNFVRERYKQYQLSVENNFDTETILQRYLSSFARSYDPHSDYLSPRNVEDFDIHMSLSLVGIGAMLRSEDGAAKIQSLIAGGPAESDGRLKPGDKIIAVAQGDKAPESILHWPLSKAVRLIRGEIGTRVVLTIIPAEDASGSRLKKIDLVRDEVKLEEQAAKGEVHEIESTLETLRLGRVILPEFYADFKGAKNGDYNVRRCSVDVRRIIEGFATNDIDGIIIDLRNDGGGSLSEAVDITGLFIPRGPIVQVRERRGIAILPDNDPSTLYEGPLIVLVNRLSASASEILAAALQDYERAVIVGDHKTHGKGTVQTVLPLSKLTDELGSIKVTTAHFYRVAGGSTQLRGITPDIVLPSLFDSLEIGEEFLPHALPWSQVRSTYFRPWKLSVKPMLLELQTRSTVRTSESLSFQTFLAKRERFRKRMEKKTISLKLSDRVNEIITEQEIEKMQEDALSGNEGDEEDPILNETLLILADLIELSSSHQLSRNP